MAALLAATDLSASFACIGAWLDTYPEQHRALLAAGHELLNHTDTHPSHDELDRRRRFDELGEAEMRAELARANRKLEGLGAAPEGFRSPHFGAQHTPRVYPLLRELGLSYSSSTLISAAPGGGAPFLASGVWEFPLLVCPRHPSASLDSWHCSTAPNAAHRDPADLRSLFAGVLELLVRHRAYGSFYWDPRVLVREDGYDGVLHLIAAARGEIRVATYGELVRELAVVQRGREREAWPLG